MRRMQYYECPLCGAHLDHGEKCDCEAEKEQKKKERSAFLKNKFMIEKSGQYRLTV